MRNKTFTLMVLAFFMSIFSFAQKPKAFDGQALKQGVSLKTSAKAPLVAFTQNLKTADSMPQPSAGKKAPAKAAEVVTPPEDGEILYYKATGVSYSYTGSDWSDPINFGRTVAVIWDGEKDVYISGLSYYVHDMYIHGRFVDESHVVFPMGQYLGDGAGAPLYSAAQDDKGKFTDIEANYDDESDTFTFTTIIADCNAAMTGMYAYIEEGLTVAPFDGEVDLPVEAPSDLEVEDYVYSATDYYTDKPINHGVKLGFYGDDVYLQGITPDFPDTWIKGSLEGNTITFPTGQMLCEYGPYTIWFLGFGDNGVEDMVFDYDPEAGILTTDYWMIICIDKYDIAGGSNCWSIDADPITIQKVTEQPGTPSNPSVSGIKFSKYGDVLELNIPLTDTDDNAMVADKLFYRLFYDTGDGEPVQVTFTPDEFIKLESDMTEVCVNFTDNYDFEAGPSVYLNMEHKSWKRIGVQSVYYGGFETHESDTTWYTPVWTEVIELPEGLTVTENTFKGFTVERDDETDEYVNVAFERTVNVALAGDSAIYIQGIGTEDATTWVKGVKTAANTFTFARGQELGLYSSYRLLLVGWDDEAEAVTDVVMTVNEASGVYTFETAFLENAGRTTRSYYWTKFVAGATIDIAGEKVKVVPATPSIDVVHFHTTGDILNFTIPAETDKETPIADTDKLSYKIYYDEGDGEAKVVTFTTDLYEKLSEDMTEIPYGFLDDVDEEGNPKGYDFYATAVYLNMPHYSWQRIGIQSLYTDEDGVNASEIGWYTPTWPQTIELPEDAEVASCLYAGSYYNSEETFSRMAKVAFVGDDVYVQGIGTEDKETWIKGTKSEGADNLYIFANGQYLGFSETYSSKLFLMGFDETVGITEVTMSYDAETSTFTTNTYLVENAEYTDKMLYNTLVVPGATIMPMVEKAGVPATPSISTMIYTASGASIAFFEIPTVDVDEYPLNTDKVSYMLYYDDGSETPQVVTLTTDLYEKLSEDMTEIPYGFTDGWDIYTDALYLNMNMRTWQRIGIQTIYTGGDETNVSEIGWYVPTWPQFVEVPEDAEIKDYGFEGQYFGDESDIDFTQSGLKVAFVGDDVYVQGVATDMNYWIKGTKSVGAEGNVTYTFANGQYVGYVQDGEYVSLLFLMGFDLTLGETEVQMTFDPETGIFTTTNYLIENADYTDVLNPTTIVAPGARLVPSDNPDAIATVEAVTEGSVRYNIAGQRVGKNFKGIVIENGNKILRK